MKLIDFVKLDTKSLISILGVKRMIIIGIILCALPIISDISEKIPFPLSLVIFGLILFTLCLLVNEGLFSIETKNHINEFYITQNIPRKTVVYGRYLSNLILTFIVTVASFIIEVAILLAMGTLSDIKMWITITAVLFIAIFLTSEIYSVISFPIYYAFGFSKGRYISSFFVTATFIAFTLIFISYTVKNPINFSTVTPETVLMIITSITLIALGVLVLLSYFSIHLSRIIYSKKEF
jgi:hypothetical protein